MNPLRADLISPLDMFKIGVGPSSSHTVGPMIAALEFRRLAIEKLQALLIKGATAANLEPELHLTVELFGSLSMTGKGHQTDGAICAGLAGLNPKSSPIEAIWSTQSQLDQSGFLEMADIKIRFRPNQDISWQHWLMDEKPLPHPNTLRFRLKRNDAILCEEVILSVGGGFIEPIDHQTGERRPAGSETTTFAPLPYPYNSAGEFVEHCKKSGLPPWQIVLANQAACGLDEKTLRARLAEILIIFDQCIERGLQTDGILPGGLNVRRRAKGLNEKMLSGKQSTWASPFGLKPSVYAIAVNEENAAGGRVVTAPTNGSSGLIPAVWRTLAETHNLSLETLQNGLIVASVVGALVKVHASISGAEVGCQGEVGTSCAMAAAGAAAMLGGNADQIEQAAEIGIEHHLGMTCDPIKGLVQVPCIERNAMGAVKALNAVELSLAGDGSHLISLDRALVVMKQTGLDMHQKYKETATGGLALG